MSESFPKTPSLDALLARLVDDTISREEFIDLERRLEQDPQAQRRYLHYLDLHAELEQRGGEAIATSEATSEANKDLPSRKKSLAVVALAISAVFIVLAGFLTWQARPPADRIWIADTDGPVQWIGADGTTLGPLEADVTLPAGTLETLSADSWLSFRFPDNSTVSMVGRGRLSISNEGGQDILRLERGNISVKASHRPPERVMRVLTPTAVAEVLGTQFNLRAGDDATRIVVNEGLVRVTRLADGQIEDVEADEVLVAALEQDSTFKAVPRRAFVEEWESVLSRDLLQGRYEPANELNPVGGARAMPHLWKGEPGRPQEAILLYTTVLDPSPKRTAPFRLAEETRLRVQGRITKKRARIQLGFATTAAHGGLVGKYSVPNGTPVESDDMGRFSFDLALSAFIPQTERIPSSAVGQEVVYLWIQTVKIDAGLLVERVQWGP